MNSNNVQNFNSIQERFTHTENSIKKIDENQNFVVNENTHINNTTMQMDAVNNNTNNQNNTPSNQNSSSKQDENLNSSRKSTVILFLNILKKKSRFKYF